jgi:[acyl-carrier-protein] S-malonyltransferase
MISVAYIFPGQGSQAVGMGRELAEVSSVAAAVFAAADDALGEPISRLAWDGPEDDLNRTENAQPALLATSIAYLAALRERQGAEGNAQTGPAAQPRFMAGHSMGQYSALVAAGVVSIEDGVRLVRERGIRMQQSGAGREGAMAAVIGLDEAAIPKLVRLASGYGVFGVANRNSPGQVVVSGERPAIDAAVEIAKSLGAKRVIVLPVSVAAHSPLMAEAADAMREVLRDIAFADPKVPLIANADAHVLDTAEACRAELVDHLTTGVDWVRAVETMAAAGVDTFIEIGPGKVLTNLIKRIAPDATALALDEAGAPGRLAIPA